MERIKKIIAKLDRKYFSRMQKRQKVYFWIFVSISAVLFWAFISAGVITHNFNRDSIKSSGDKQELEVKSMILTESKEGQKSWEIFGETGEYSSDHKVAKLYNVIGNFYKDNKVNMSFQSSQGTYNEETHNIDLYDNTYVVLENNISVLADHITYYSDTKTITAQGNVKINQNGKFIATADEAFVDSGFSVFKIKGNTITRIYESNDSKTSGTEGL
ncbi:MAG: LPS export ABC transporter periplasmic protein LptC [Candidatus Gastranaerophilaceae bacterium]